MKNRYKIFLYSFLFAILVLAVLFRNNTVYNFLGNYYFNRGNTNQAIFFYEKSLNNGNTDYKLRERYVKTLINSPLNVKAQEKLVKIAEGDIKDGAYWDAVYFLFNLKREIHNKYPKNYVIYAPFNQQIVHWGKMPITYGFKNQQSAPDEIIRSVSDAFNEWERASSCRIKFKQVKINPDIWVEFIRDDVKNPEYGRKYVVAYTTPTITQSTLENMVIKLNLINLEGKLYTPNQIYNTSLHEIFHALGFMGHSPNEKNIMHMAKDKDSMLNDTKRAVTGADKITLELLYKTKPDITNASELEYSYVPYLILGDDENINYSKLREAKNYIRKAPSIPNGYIDMAGALAEQKRYREASDNLEKALRLARDKDTKYIINYNLAVISFRQDLFELAVDYANAAKEIQDTEELHFLLAEIWLKQNNTEKAIKEYEYLISQSPQNIDYPMFLANIYLQKRSFFKARSVLKTFLKNNPQEKNNPKLNAYRNLFL